MARKVVRTAPAKVHTVIAGSKAWPETTPAALASAPVTPRKSRTHATPMRTAHTRIEPSRARASGPASRLGAR